MRILVAILTVLLLATPASARVYDRTEKLLQDARDGMTNALQTIEYEHHEIHAGSSYFIVSYDSIGSGEDISFTFTTPSGTKKSHLIFTITGKEPYRVTLWEDATITGGTGTTVTTYNANRDSSNTSGVTVSRDSTITSHGTILQRFNEGVAGTGPQSTSTPGTGGRASEIILDDGSTYLFVITSDAASNVVGYEFDWYEHTDKR